MSVPKHEPQWWHDVFQTEFRLPCKCNQGWGILPGLYEPACSSRLRSPRKFMKTFLMKVRRFFRHKLPATSVVSCADPLEAYMYACIAAPFFCYVSPAIYRLTAPDNDTEIRQDDSR